MDILLKLVMDVAFEDIPSNESSMHALMAIDKFIKSYLGKKVLEGMRDHIPVPRSYVGFSAPARVRYYKCHTAVKRAR